MCQNQCVKISDCTFICRKHFFAFFLLNFYIVIKKKFKARCIKQKSECYRPAFVQRLWFQLCWLQLALCLRHLTLAEEEEEVVVGDGVGVSRSSATPPPLIPLDESVKTLFSLALKLADSTSSLSGLLLYTNRRNHSRGWSEQPQQQWRSCQRSPQSRTSIPS